MENIDMLQSATRPKVKKKHKPRKTKRQPKPDMIDRLAAMLERKMATGYSWLDDETPGKDW